MMRRKPASRIRNPSRHSKTGPSPAITAVAALALLVGCAAAHYETASADSPLSALDWLIGEWAAETDTSRVHETWQRVSPDTMEGFGEITRKASGAIDSSESLRLLTMSGEVFYLAKVSENPLPIAFRLTAFSDTRFVFENPAHDFPTRIIYERRGPDEMRAIVSGSNGKGFTLNFVRAD